MLCDTEISPEKPFRGYDLSLLVPAALLHECPSSPMSLSLPFLLLHLFFSLLCELLLIL